MANLTEKQNLQLVLDGQIPEWIPRMAMGPTRGIDTPPTTMSVGPGFLSEHRMPGGSNKDIWGVEYITSKEAAGGMIPKTWDFLLDDITKWHDVIKAPSLEGIDWEQMCKKDLAKVPIDRNQSFLSMGNGCGGYFQTLMAFMGFTEGLCALSEEPEECKALFEYLADFYVTVLEKTVDHYKADFYSLADDTAAWGNPFVSLNMFREYFLPLYKREIDIVKERGMYVNYHNCGKCEIFMDDMVEAGIDVWNPAQICNDLDAIQAKHGRKLILAGCWDVQQITKEGNTDEDIYNYIKGIADARAKNGGFCFQSFILIPDPNDTRLIHVDEFVNKSIEKIGHEFYK